MPGQLDVVDVPALAADEARVLLAQHPAVADRLLVVVVELEVLGRLASTAVMTRLPAVSALAARRSASAAASCSAAHWTERTMVA